MYKLTDKQAVTLVKIADWWKDELVKKGKRPDLDKRLDWMMNIITKKKYTDKAKQFLNQMREMYLGNPSQTTPKQPKSKPFRSTVNVNGFPMV